MPQPPFADVTAQAGLDFVHVNGMSDQRYFVEMVGAGGGLFDYDNDGDLDLFLAQGHALGSAPPAEPPPATSSTATTSSKPAPCISPT